MSARRPSPESLRPRAPRRLLAAAALLVPAMALAGCSSEGGRETTAAGEGGGGQAAQTDQIKIAMITHAAPGDTFWDRIRAGAE